MSIPKGRFHNWLALVIGLGLFSFADEARGQSGRVLGLVVDVEGRDALENVAITLDQITILSDARGRFLFPNVDPGPSVMTTEIVGYLTRVDTVDVLPSATTEVLIPLGRDPVRLDPIEVVQRSRVLEQRGFFGRRESGYAGHFFTREDLLERSPRDVTELLRPLPGVRLLNSGLEGDVVVFNRAINISGGGLCQPALFLDGIKSSIRLYDMILDPEHVEGIEVYTGAGIPGRFNDPCGAVLVWTRVP